MKINLTIASAIALGMALTLAQSAGAATWAGGNGNWAGAGVTNWGLGTGSYPGDATHTNEPATLNNGSTVLIQSGDSLHLGGATAVADINNSSTIRMTGGTYISDNRIQIRNSSRIDLLGGTLTGKGNFWVSAGGVWNVDGGEFGTRVTTHDGLPTGGGAADAIFQFNGTGNGTLLVTESGIVDIHTIDMNDQTGAGNALVEVHGVVPADSDAFKRSTLFWQLNKSSAGTSATAKFVFSSAGITPWRVFSNNGLNLGTGANRGLLDADVSALLNDGTTGFTLVNYVGAIQGAGTFGGITVRSNGELLRPGPQGNLGIGQYYLAMNGGDGSDIVLFYNIPEPSTVVLLGMGALFLAARRRLVKSTP